MVLLESITDLVETRRLTSFHMTLYKIKAHTNIRANDLPDAAVKLAVRNFDTLPPAHTTRVGIGEIAPRPTPRVMYRLGPTRPDPALPASIIQIHAPPTMVDHSGSGPPANARIHPPIPSIPA